MLDKDRWDKDKNPTSSVKQILNIIYIQVVKKGFNKSHLENADLIFPAIIY